MATPAQRYAESRRHTSVERGPLADLRRAYPFELDDFQVRACRAVQEGRGVLVAAPTGSGKTVVGEFAVQLALDTGRKAFYTTPIKALSNQKYADLVRRHGSAAVGLLTGDNSVNPGAPVVVMTTEVLRNMLYADSAALTGLGYVVMDEVHYLADRFRGAVWEEVIIHLPDDVCVISLSATVSNAEEFGAWLDTVRGDTEVVVSEHRPVPLWQHVMLGSRLYDLFAEAGSEGGGRPRPDGELQLHPDLRRAAREAGRQGFAEAGHRGRRPGPARGGRGAPRGVPSRAEVALSLDSAGLLPAITFIFSRAGCDAAVRQCIAAGVRLTTPEEREQIHRVVDARCADIPDEDLAVLGYWEWAEALERGVAAHHAGLLPTFKEVVEDLFTGGLVKVVYATETLALGINMPARSVVLERLVKFNGETHAAVTAGEYTQLTGRAGRRGIDVEGHAVVLWHPGLDLAAVGGLASTRTYPLRSSFRPTYSMAVNLVGQVGRSRAREILETSFAQFQADRAVVGLARQARRQEEALAGYAEAMRCHLGDFTEYAALRRQLSQRETQLSRASSADRRADAVAVLERLRRGDVVLVQSGRRAGHAVVVEVGVAGGADGPRPTVLTADRRLRRLTLVELPGPPELVTRIAIPKHFNARSPQSRRDLASTLRNALAALPGTPARPALDRQPPAAPRAADDEQLRQLRRGLRSHPCHGCTDREEHARWAERHHRLGHETEALLRKISGRTTTVATVFDGVCDVLTELGYLRGDAVTEHGRQLRRIYTEADLLVAECLRRGVWSGLDAPGLAACVSAVVYSARREDRSSSPRLPSGAVSEAYQRTLRIAADLQDAERRRRLDATPEPDAGLVRAVHRWANGQPLRVVLEDGELAPGDFVRWCKQVVDLLGQLRLAAADPALRTLAGAAIDRVRRGVVAYSCVV